MNDGFLGLFVGLEWRNGMMECTFTFTLASFVEEHRYRD